MSAEITARLDLRRPIDTDVPGLFAILSDPRVWVHLPSGQHTELGQTARSVQRWIQDWERDGIGRWVVRERGAARVIGYGGVSELGGTTWNLGYRFSADSQGRGFATELSHHAIRRGRETAPERPIIAYLLEHNAASAAVARKVGLHLVDSGSDRGNPDPAAKRLVFADRDLTATELAVAHR